jgi:dTDP-4-dehydrorhamnose reductase
MLVTGGSGQLGTAMRSVFPDASYPGRAELDLADIDGLREVLDRLHPQAIVNCAAYTAVDAAEDDEASATRVNGEAVGAMAEHAAARGIPFVTFSTDYVFAGTATEPYVESDATDPVNAYGRSKLLGERLALAAYPGALVIRTSWLISATHPNFVATMLRLTASRDRLDVVDDQLGSPTVAADLAVATREALDAGVNGLLHVTNLGTTTWFGLAVAAVDLAGLDASRLHPCTTAEFPTPAARPAFSVLGSERREPLGLDPMPHWRDSLGVVVAGHIGGPCQ